MLILLAERSSYTPPAMPRATHMKHKHLTSFQQKVYTVVKRIPQGEVRTYAWVAEKINRPRAVRAVGSALNKNPFPIIVPCHRVVRSNGDIGEYAFGKDLKKKLLEIEGFLCCPR
jgi:methylated-DNA-[protein]-cysteine S-methyltransferase